MAVVLLIMGSIGFLLLGFSLGGQVAFGTMRRMKARKHGEQHDAK